jgi:hypothetical protein
MAAAGSAIDLIIVGTVFHAVALSWRPRLMSLAAPRRLSPLKTEISSGKAASRGTGLRRLLIHTLFAALCQLFVLLGKLQELLAHGGAVHPALGMAPDEPCSLPILLGG